MNFNKQKILRITLVACISLLLMFGAQWYYSKRIIEKTLINELLSKPSVVNVDVKKQRDSVILYIELKKVDNLKEVYGDVYNSAQHHLKGQPFSLRFQNEPNKFLDQLYNSEIQFIVYEGLSTGKFTEMKAMLDSLSSKNGSLDIKVFLDSENLYLQLHNDDSDYYNVIGREN